MRPWLLDAGGTFTGTFPRLWALPLASEDHFAHSTTRHAQCYIHNVKHLPSCPYSLLTFSRVVFALFIISKAGGLIYNREFYTGMSKLTSNDYLMLAGSFHGYVFPHHIYGTSS
jgi:hypothetical protein